MVLLMIIPIFTKQLLRFLVREVFNRLLTLTIKPDPEALVVGINKTEGMTAKSMELNQTDARGLMSAFSGGFSRPRFNQPKQH
jgi:hypothetical protein